MNDHHNVFTQNFYTEVKIINRFCTECGPFKNISAFYITCHLLFSTKYFGLKRKVAGGAVKVQEFKASSCALSLLTMTSDILKNYLYFQENGRKYCNQCNVWII